MDLRETDRQREIETEKHMDLLFHSHIHSLLDSYVCPDQGSNPQPWHMRMML